MNNNDERDYAEEAANAALMREGDEPYVDRVHNCFICGGLIEHYSDEPESLWHHVVVRNHTPEKKPTHEIRTKFLPGGPVEAWCTCGGWRGVAVNSVIAERDGSRHLKSMGVTS